MSVGGGESTVFAGLVTARFGLGDPAGTPRAVQGGFLNIVWRLESSEGVFSVKEVMPRAGWGELAYRYRRAMRVEQSARASGVRLPMPVPDTTGEALALIDLPPRILGVVVHQWVHGNPLPPAPVSAPFAAKVGATLGRLHRLRLRPTDQDLILDTPSAMPTWHDWTDLTERATVAGWSWAEHLAASAAALADIGALVDDLASSSFDLILSHRDIGPRNLLDVDGEPVVLDWETVGPTTIAGELGHTVLDLADAENQDPDPAILRSFLHGYRRYAPLPESDACWLVDWYSAVTRFLYLNVRRCLRDYDDASTSLERWSSIVVRLLDDVPNRITRADRLVADLAAALEAR